MANYQQYKEIVVNQEDKILIIRFNNPKKYNSLSRKAYVEISQVLRQVAEDESIVFVVFTGVGEYFSAGNDLSQSNDSNTDMDTYIEKSNANFNEMVSALIDCPKVMIALVNGPAIGIGSTLVGLCDLVWCSKTAYFLTPFTKLGIVPESCSSYVFPKVIGRSMATEMLLLSERLSAEEALRCGFVSRIYDPAELDSVIWPRIREYTKLPPGAIQTSKKLIRSLERDNLYKSLYAESTELKKRFYTEEFFNAILEFASRKRKSKL